MKEKDFDTKTKQEETKLEWEAPRLISLDKEKTDGNPTFTGPTETASYHS